MLTRLTLFLLWLIHFLPLPLQAKLGQWTGLILYWLARDRRHIARTNIRLCFPEKDTAQQQQLVKDCFQYFARSFIERGILWWSTPKRLNRLIQVNNHHYLTDILQQHPKQPVILLAPHFVALDAGWTWLSQHHTLVTVYSKQKNRYFNQKLLAGRQRFGQSKLYVRQRGMRPVIKALRQGLPFYYLPDQDFNIKDGIFSPFFGIATATLTALPRLAQITDAVIIPVTTKMRPDGQGYQLQFHPPWQHYPCGNLEADTRRMNAFIEQAVQDMPAQYFWLHKRFKTRPKGEAGLY